MTISSYDFQVVPSDYDDRDYNFEYAPVVVTYRIFNIQNSVIVALNQTLSDDQIMELQGRIEQCTQEFCNEITEENQRTYAGF